MVSPARAGQLLAAAGLGQAVDQIGARLGVQNIPGLGFAMKAGSSLNRMCVFVIGVHLNREIIGRINELGQQREIGAIAREATRANQIRAIFQRQIGQAAPGVRAANNKILLVDLPRFGQIGWRIDQTKPGAKRAATPDPAIQPALQAQRGKALHLYDPFVSTIQLTLLRRRCACGSKVLPI
jgi:hypothetical protein